MIRAPKDQFQNFFANFSFVINSKNVASADDAE